MKYFTFWLIFAVLFLGLMGLTASDAPDKSIPLGLPSIQYPENNPQTPEKIALGDKLFNDKRFSANNSWI